MFDYSLLVDLAKTRQAELLQEVEKYRIHRELKPKNNAVTVLKRLRIILSNLG